MEIHYHSHGSIRYHSSRTTRRRCSSWDIGTTHSSSIVHANGTWKRKLKNSPGRHSDWGLTHHSRATKHRVSSLQCYIQGQSPSLLTSFALLGQDKLILHSSIIWNYSRLQHSPPSLTTKPPSPFHLLLYMWPETLNHVVQILKYSNQDYFLGSRSSTTCRTSFCISTNFGSILWVW